MVNDNLYDRAFLIEKLADCVDGGAYARKNHFNHMADAGVWNRNNPESPITGENVAARYKANVDLKRLARRVNHECC